MSEDIWAFLSKGAGPDDWYIAEIRLRRRGGGGPSAVLRADSRFTNTAEVVGAALDDYIRAFKHIASMETEQ